MARLAGLGAGISVPFAGDSAEAGDGVSEGTGVGVAACGAVSGDAEAADSGVGLGDFKAAVGDSEWVPELSELGELLGLGKAGASAELPGEGDATTAGGAEGTGLTIDF